MDLTNTLDQAFRHTHGIIKGVRTDQYGDPTPCDEWTVRDLLEHTISVVAGLGAAASGQPPSGEFELGSDPAAQFKQAAATTLAAWQAPGVLEQIIDGPAGPMPGHVLAGINLMDTATHAWDLAMATGQSAGLPDDVAEAAMEASRQIISPETRPGRFGPELTASKNAGATERLVAFLGRKA